VTAPTLEAIRAAYTGPAARTPLGVLRREAHHAQTMLAAIDAVAHLHSPEEGTRMIWCQHCSDVSQVEWPCPTLQTLTSPFTPPTDGGANALAR
jgi:hypothetical protein